MFHNEKLNPQLKLSNAYYRSSYFPISNSWSEVTFLCQSTLKTLKHEYTTKHLLTILFLWYKNN